MDTEVLFLVLGFSGLAISIVYWMRRSLVPGIVAVLVNLGAGLYWIQIRTTLPQLAWIWIGMGLACLFDFFIRIAFQMGDQIADTLGYRWDFLRKNDEEEE